MKSDPGAALEKGTKSHTGSLAEFNPRGATVLWLTLCGVILFFYLALVVHPEVLYQVAQPDASCGYLAIHPDDGETLEMSPILYSGRLLISIASTTFWGTILYGGLGLLGTLLLWGLMIPRTISARLLCCAPLCVYVAFLQLCYAYCVSCTCLWILLLAALLLSKWVAIRLGSQRRGIAWIVTLVLVGAVLFLGGWQVVCEPFCLGWERSAARLSRQNIFTGSSHLYYALICWLVVPASAALIWFAGQIKQTAKRLQYGLTSGAVLVLLIIVGSTFFSSQGIRNRAYIQSQARQGNYVNALTAAAELETMDKLTACTIRYCLYKQGQLLENLLVFPLDRETTILPSIPFYASEPYYKILLEMGLINSAEHFATETLESYGDLPEVLLDLGIIYILKNQPEAARVYWGYLAKNPLWRSRANELVETSKSDPTMRNHPLIQPYYAYRFTDNYFFLKDPAEFQMRQSLQKYPANRMALEFLAAEYLGYMNHESFEALLPAFRALNYPRLPRHVEEMLCLLAATESPTDLCGYTISPLTRMRYDSFRKLWTEKRALSNTDLFRALAPEYGDTYWFYHLFGMTGTFGLNVKGEAEK